MPVVITGAGSASSSVTTFFAQGNGQPDSFFVAEVRRCLRDQPVWQEESPAADGQRGAYGSSASPVLHLQRSPVGRTLIPALTAPSAGATQPGFVSYLPIFDPAPPIGMPVQTPSIADGGAGGTFPGGTYVVVYTYQISGSQFGLSFPSNALSLGANHQLTVNALSGLPNGVTAINPYVVQAPAGGSIGALSTIPVTSNATAATTYAAPPSGGILPALLISDTGELFFPLAPQSGSISISYQTFRFGDQQIVDALYEGLDLLWPDVWTPQPFDTTSVLPSPVQWEYVLPAAYADQRCVIQEVEVRPPSAFIIYTRKSGWRFINDSVAPTLIFERPPPPGGVVRITYAIPFQKLADVPTIAQFLPIYYAVSRLLADQEVMRSRADDLPALTAENAGAEKGGSTQAAAWWLQNMFYPALKKLSLGFPARRAVMSRVVEKLNLGPIWQGMS